MKVFLYRSWSPAGYYYVVGPNRSQVERDCEMLGPMLYEGSVPHEIVRDNMEEIPVVIDSGTSGLHYKSIATAINHSFPVDPCGVCETRICGKKKEEKDARKES